MNGITVFCVFTIGLVVGVIAMGMIMMAREPFDLNDDKPVPDPANDVPYRSRFTQAERGLVRSRAMQLAERDRDMAYLRAKFEEIGIRDVPMGVPVNRAAMAERRTRHHFYAYTSQPDHSLTAIRKQIGQWKIEKELRKARVDAFTLGTGFFRITHVSHDEVRAAFDESANFEPVKRYER